MKKRAILIVLDSVGIGALPDAADFGDEGAHTLGNIYHTRGKLNLPHLYSMGLSAIEGSRLPRAKLHPAGAYGRCMETTHAKDTTCGHWEMTGLPLPKPFRTFPNGFPRDLMDRFEQAIGSGTLGNEVASGTEIIQRFGDEHMRTGKPIVYTSADSVFQIAAHEEVIPLERLYEICKIAREMLTGEYLVGRVIARPFLGGDGVYKRTENRRDYAIAPFEDTILDGLTKAGKTTVGVGKIEDIFCNRGLTLSDHTKNNPSGVDTTIRFLHDARPDFIFTNLVDFDMLYGHRNDVEGYAQALEYFDKRLPEILNALEEDDLLLITADHGCDPTWRGTDHTREYIPLLAYGEPVKSNTSIGTRSTFADIGATIYEYLTGGAWRVGTSFLHTILKEETL